LSSLRATSDEVVAALGEHQGERMADAAAGAGDERDGVVHARVFARGGAPDAPAVSRR